MRRVALLGLVLGLTRCTCGSPEIRPGAVRVQIDYSGFRPGCVELLASDANAPERNTTVELLPKSPAADGQWIVAVYRPDGWSDQLRLSARAHEQSCSGAVVFERVEPTHFNPGAVTEVVLQLQAVDADGDGYVAVAKGGTDCDDGNDLIHPGATELCNATDDNCNGKIDEGVPPAPYYADLDHDGFGAGAAMSGCVVPSGDFATVDGDCDDHNPAIHPGAAELCDGKDNDCDHVIDNGFEVGQACASGQCTGAWVCQADGTRSCSTASILWYPDQDQDHYGDNKQTGKTGCTAPDAGYVPNALDCNDNDPTIYVGAPELCDGKDNNCIGGADEGYNVGTTCTVQGCSGKFYCVVADGGVACDAPAPVMAYIDSDRDNFGSSSTAATPVCPPINLGSGFSLNNTDCDDTRSAVNPNATERCNNIDDNCVNGIDEGFNRGTACDGGGCAGTIACAADGGTLCDTGGEVLLYVDDDGDGFGKKSPPAPICAVPSRRYVTDHTDCDDGDPFTNPKATEICDGRDNDCDGAVEGPGVCPSTPPAWTSRSINGATELRAASGWADGYLWVGGASKALWVRNGSDPFNSHQGQCSFDINAVWSDSKGKVYVGGGSRLASHDGGSTCTLVSLPSSGSVNITSLVGLPVNIGKDLFVVSSNGESFRWQSQIQALPPVSASLNDVHGISTETLFAVGSETIGAVVQPRIFRFDGAKGQWMAETLSATLSAGALNGVFVVNDHLAYAVGDKGLFLSWNGQGWAAFTPSVLTVDNFTSVLAFGSSQIYATDDGGHVSAFNGSAWNVVVPVPPAGSPLGPLLDITGTSPADLWAVGRSAGGNTTGLIWHWPQ